MAVTLDSSNRTRQVERTTPSTTEATTNTAPTNTATGFATGDTFGGEAPVGVVPEGDVALQAAGDGGGGSGSTEPVEFHPVSTPEPTLNDPPAKIENEGERLSEDQIEEILFHVGGAHAGGDALVNRLLEHDLSGAAQLQLIDEIISNPENYQGALTSFGGEPRNVAYDNMEVVASAVADAYEAGVITDEELHDYMEELGPEEAAYFMGTLATDPENTGVGGVVEAAAAQAEALGFEQAAAVGYTSSQELIDEHLPTDEAQQDAFNQVLDFVETAQEYQGGNPRPDSVAVMANAVGGLARLSANGNGFSEGEFAEFLNDFEPGYGMGDSASFTNEVLARMRVVPGDTEPGGAVELIGKASAELAQSADEDERGQWDVNAQIAFTSSDALIEANLTTPEAREHAFSVLTRQANALHGEARDAAENDPPYSLLEYPAVVDGATRLMAQHGEELLDSALNAGAQGEAELLKFFQNTLFSPYATEEQRGRVDEVLNSYVESRMANVDNDGVQVGNDVGTLLGLVQRAGEAAVSRAGDVESESSLAQDVLNSVITKLGSTAATAAVSALTGGNVLAGGLAGTATSTFLSGILGKEPDPETLREDLEEAFIQMIEEGGGDINAGELIRDQLTATYEVVSEDLNDRIDAIDTQLANPNLDPAQRQDLETQRRALEGERDDLEQSYEAVRDAFTETIVSNELNDAIEDYEED